MTDTKSHYDGTLNDLYTGRAACVRSLADYDQAISALQRVMKSKGMMPPTASVSAVPADTPHVRSISMMPSPGRRFSVMSVRWAILILLDEAKSPMSQAELTEALESEGIRAKSKATNFGNNVSAVLSNMKSPRNEIEVVEGKYEITEKGRSAIHHIKITRGIA